MRRHGFRQVQPSRSDFFIVSVPAFWGWYGVNWGMHGSIVVDGGGHSRIAYGNAVWGGGNWQHPGGGVSHGGFGG
jgi:hypothetical protein